MIKFQTSTGKFQKGWYTLENAGSKNAFYWLVYPKNKTKGINTCGLMLEYFSELPNGVVLTKG